MRQQVIDNGVCLIDVLGRAHPFIHIRKSSHLLTETLQTIAGLEAEPHHQALELKLWPSWPSKRIIFIECIIEIHQVIRF